MGKVRIFQILWISFYIILGFLLALFILSSLGILQKEQIPQLNFSSKTMLLQEKNRENCTKNILSNNNQLTLNNQKSMNETLNITAVQREYSNQTNSLKNLSPIGLLSPRIYTGILQPKSFLIANFDPLKVGLKSYLNEHNLTASIYIENLRNGVSMGINENEGYFPASLNKLPIAILIMQKVEDGRLTLDTKLPIEENDRTDSYGTLYLAKEKELTVRVLLEKMLRESDNTALNVLFDHVDRSELTRLLDYLDIKENVEYPFIRVEYGSSTNLVTPIEMYNVFSSLYLSTVLYAQDSEYILSLLTKTTDFDVNRAANLPDNVTIADKFGEYYIEDTKLFHDCGIMYIDTSKFFFCIMMKNVELEDARNYIGYTINYIYNYIVDTRAKLKAK